MSNEKFEKFIELADDYIDTEIDLINRKNSSDGLIYTYIVENKHKLRRVAAIYLIDDRQNEVRRYIKESLNSANIYNYDNDTICRALNKIGIITTSRTMVYIGIVYLVLLCVISSTIFIYNDRLSMDDGYPLLFVVNLCSALVAFVLTMITYMFIEGTKFRLFGFKE